VHRTGALQGAGALKYSDHFIREVSVISAVQHPPFVRHDPSQSAASRDRPRSRMSPFQFVVQGLISLKARHCHVQDRADAGSIHTIDNIRSHPRLRGGANTFRARIVGKHHDRTRAILIRYADLLQRIAVWRVLRNDHNIRTQSGDLNVKSARGIHAGHYFAICRLQSGNQHGKSFRLAFNNQYTKQTGFLKKAAPKGRRIGGDCLSIQSMLRRLISSLRANLT